MGLLDDAIREHLELKRLKGADPGEVARDENEALGEEVSKPVDEGWDEEAVAADPPPETPQEREDAEDLGEIDLHPPSGQETVEFDMGSVLASRTESRPGSTGGPQGQAATPTGPTHNASQAEDSLEWEMPGESGMGDEERRALGDSAEEEEPVEDVLEETPDFLRDTPEQERLWFEQRPPRDFDFNE